MPALVFKVIESALKECEQEEWYGSCSFWLYRGKEKAFEPHEIDMSVPLSPAQMERKERALMRYQSLSSLELAAPTANRESAKLYDNLGLAEYEAMECFQRWKRA